MKNFQTGIPDPLPAHLRSNPVFKTSEKLNFVPRWDLIKFKHLKPAMEYAFAVATQNIEAIATNPNPPTFKNTTEASDEATELAGMVLAVIATMIPKSDKEHDDLHDLYEWAWAEYVHVFNKIVHDERIYDRHKAVKAAPSFKNLSQQRRYLWDMYDNTFKQAGIELGDEKQAEIDRIDKRVAKLGTRFQKNIQDAQDRYISIKNPERLSGLPDTVIEAAAQRAREAGYDDGRWVFNTAHESIGPVMERADDRTLRERLWRKQHTANAQGRYDNRAIAIEYMQLLNRKAQMVGYKHAAALYHCEQMMETPDKVAKFLRRVRYYAKKKAKEELAALSAFAKERDGIETLEPWDVKYYLTAYRREKMGFDPEDLRPYFEIESVIKGAFQHLGRLMDMEFIETDRYPTFHPSVKAYDVYQGRSRRFLGPLFLDLMERQYKPNGIAWHSSMFYQGLFGGKVRRPVDIIQGKFLPGKKGMPTLLSFDEVWTFWHEKGHVGHNMSAKARHVSLGGYATQAEFAEFPSQVMEQWLFEPTVLDTFARHYKTGMPIPDKMKKKLKEWRKFGSGLGELDRVERAMLDLAWGMGGPDDPDDIAAFEKRRIGSFRLLPTHGAVRTPTFDYSFGGGYDLIFYSYTKALEMSHDMFARFQCEGLYNRGLRAKFKRAQELGGTEYAATMYRSIMGRSPRIEPYLHNQGLISGEFNWRRLDAANEEPEEIHSHPTRRGLPGHARAHARAFHPFAA